MYLSLSASRAREREAENARRNRLEIVRALSHGEITRRDLFKWGLLTASGVIAAKHGLSPYVRSAYAAVPTGTPRSPLFGAKKFTQRLPRLALQTPSPLYEGPAGSESCYFQSWPSERPAQRLSYHTDYNDHARKWPNEPNPFVNPLTRRGPCEGRPWGEWFAHQLWNERWLRPRAGYVLSLSEVRPNSRFHPLMPAQAATSLWCYGTGRGTPGNPVPPLIKARYGEPVIMRVYNNLPDEVTRNGGFGRNEHSLHLHNGHNAAESDGASNAYHFPGTFYDYLWSFKLARHDMINTAATVAKASGPDGSGGVSRVPGDFREILSSIWFHDHRFFFTAENVYKGMFGVCNLYSGPDRGNESISGGGVNLRLPSGRILDWGNTDFDVNLAISNPAFDPNGQLYFDIFDTDGFLGDVLAVNGTYAPFMEVLPRKYRFRLLNGAMSRFIRLALADQQGRPVPFQLIANDGNLLVNPIRLTSLDEQASGERYDIVVDFSRFAPGETVRLVNLLRQTDGRKPDKTMSMSDALRGVSEDPTVGPLLEFRVRREVESVDAPGTILTAANEWGRDTSVVPAALTEQIPIVTPARRRVIEWNRSGNDLTNDTCVPECGGAESFPWSVKVNGEASHGLNANRISALIPKQGETEHWTLVNGGGGWDHPIHLHFEEGITIDRGDGFIGPHEKLARKDVWRLRPSGQVTIQVTFGDFGGAYVNHCHNTVHEDFAMLMRFQILADRGIQAQITPTPIPTRDGVTYRTPTVLPEADPKNVRFFRK